MRDIFFQIESDLDKDFKFIKKTHTNDKSLHNMH